MDFTRNTPLMSSILRHQFYLSQQLIVNGSYDLNTQNVYGDTALMYAAGVDHRITELLLKFGANPNLSDRSGCSPLIWSAEKGNFESVKLLIDAGAYINVRQFNGNTAMSVACFHGDVRIIQLLIDNGFSLYNQRDFSGNTPLMIATRYGYLSIVKLLLQQKVDVNIINYDNDNALSIACHHQRFDIVKILISHGCKIHLNERFSPRSLNLLIRYSYPIDDKLIAELLQRPLCDIEQIIDEIDSSIIKRLIQSTTDIKIIQLLRMYDNCHTLSFHFLYFTYRHVMNIDHNPSCLDDYKDIPAEVLESK
jgi:ankyrin repeat protein